MLMIYISTFKLLKIIVTFELICRSVIKDLFYYYALCTLLHLKSNGFEVAIELIGCLYSVPESVVGF